MTTRISVAAALWLACCPASAQPSERIHREGPTDPLTCDGARIDASAQCDGALAASCFERAIAAFDALRAIAQGVAWQDLEEHGRGRLEVAAQQDTATLPEDRLAVEPQKNAAVEIRTTIQEDKTIGEATSPTDEDPRDPLDLLQGDWRLQRLGDRAVGQGGDVPTLTVSAEGQVSGFTGVNRLMGRVVTDGTTLFGPLASTRRGGPPAAMQLESAYLAALGKAMRVRRMTAGLELLDADGNSLLTLHRASQ